MPDTESFDPGKMNLQTQEKRNRHCTLVCLEAKRDRDRPAVGKFYPFWTIHENTYNK